MKRGIFLLLILLLGFVSASASFGNYSIDSHYSSLGSIKGWINMSFTEEPTQSLFTDSFGNEVALLEVLESNDNILYSCSTDDCGFDYNATNGNPSVSLELGIGSEKLLGFFIDEDIDAIRSVSFVVNSTTEKSCYNQLTFDFGIDGTIESGNAKPSLERCPFLKNYGCYKEGSGQNVQISKSPSKQCQGINLTEGAGFNIGAWISSVKEDEITMALYNVQGEKLASCILENLDGEGEYDCGIDYLVKAPGKYYVCISSNGESVEDRSSIKGYADEENGCGFNGEEVGIMPEVASYKIFAENRKFDKIGTMNVSDNLEGGNSLAGEVNDYLMEKYGSLDCLKGCVVPFKIYSKTNQNVVLRNLSLEYKTNIGQRIGEKFYEIEGIASTVNMNPQLVYIDEAGFKVPSQNGELNFTLNFGDQEILSTKIYVEELAIPKYVLPTKTASAFPTPFKVLVDSNISIKEYKWDFGDNTTETTTTNEVTHTYENSSTYQMKVTVVDYSGREASEKFNIIVTSPKELIEQTITEMSASIESVSSNIGSREPFHQMAIKNAIDIDYISDEFKQIQRDYQSAQTESEYNAIVKRLIEIRVPSRLTTSMQAENFPFFPTPEVINLEVIQTIAGGDYIGEEDRYIEAIRTWEQENLDVKIDFNEVSGIYEEGPEEITKIFKIQIKEKENMGSNAYLIIKDMEGIIFKENYLEENESGYLFIDLNDPEKTIQFATTEDIDFANLPLFISPSLERLDLMEPPSKRIANMKWSTIIWIIVIIIIFGFGTYIFLQEWYKRRYENYLFDKRNDLYNLIVYAKHAKESGMNENQIKSKLKKQGWSGEQVDYVIKKYLGKRTGMIEIPISKIIDKIKELFSKFKKNKTDKNLVNKKSLSPRGLPTRRGPPKGTTPSRKI